MAVVIARRRVGTGSLADAAAPADGSTPAPPSDGEATNAGGAGGDTTGAEWPYALFAVAAIIIYWFAFVAQRVYPDLKPHDAVKVAEGVAAFAMFYVAAQAVERFLEPLVAMDPIKRRLASERATKIAAAAASGSANATQVAATAQAALDQWRANRSVVIFAIATILGMAASAFLGLYFISSLVTGPVPDVNVDVLVTGLVIGGGSKPLHDLITNVQKSSNAKSDATTSV